ncbi:Cardiolipin synthase [Campylobacter sputorum subsp. bubulus]|uniref:Cardiolipin synthase n=1 Tax=Campylobacter sputorum subsp. sputorum TaxID=32024 RepID=A0A381DIP6_9BACT|nr:cardiolipin synthase [Campylobacter sputorum]ASM35384.1 cardiolipin synthetase [Campylobacter sputorum aubsp. sputorum RM3237]KAB0582872.1 cardiolipin synthase [Campylobacter sputorum subsp. sputorum]QEL05576.1 cardiolipin synthase family protein [Campylobacter sputorum subsp. sputorum]SUX08603.1 Cardiolipin synthase [Campylobacter sputorum subsp. bubulus]SUX10341.1 Cardiolipin synthase [Campylobacter sputorum subsp. sputorum]
MENFINLIISFNNIYFIIWLIFAISILLSNKASSDTTAWLLAITFVPIVGIIAYLLFGINWRQRKFINKQLKSNKQDLISILNANFSKYDSINIFSKNSIQNLEKFQTNDNISEKNRSVINLLYNSEKTLPVEGNRSYKIYYNGKDAFSSLINDILNAKKSIYMQYYIWHSDKLGTRIKDILVKKAKEGLEIKLIFDGLGSFRTISKAYRNELKQAGVEFLYFLDIKTSILKLNYRNHRKMTIIDNDIVHTGGMNLADQYINGGNDYDNWRDTNIRLKGNIFVYYLVIFITDWLNSGGKFDLKNIQNDIKAKLKNKTETKYIAQVSSSGPDSNYPNLKFLYTKMITETKNEILIQTPYFIPTDSILNQLKIASLSSKKVKIMIAQKPDHKIMAWVSKTYYEELLLAGIEIYIYTNGFLHSKVLICDDDLSTIGTCNFDNRSFNINYEINTIFYDKKISQELKDKFYEDMKYCKKISLSDLKRYGVLQKLRDHICKIISPLL